MAGVASFAKGLILLAAVSSMLAVSFANRTMVGGGYGNPWGPNTTFDGRYGWRPIPPPNTNNTIVVGGSENTWRFGFNYADWAFRNGPFFLNDTLVFKYDPPSNNTAPHSVYLLRNFWSYRRCNLRGAKRIGSVTQGGGEGFKFTIKSWQPHYFACGEHNGIHCNLGKMKLMVMPMPFPRYPAH